MGKVVIGLALVVVLGIGAAWLVEALTAPADPYQIVVWQAQAAATQTALAQAQADDAARAAVWTPIQIGAGAWLQVLATILVSVLGLGIVGLFLSRGGIAVVQAAQAPKRRIVTQGPVAVPLEQVLSGQAAPLLGEIAAGHYAAELARAQRGGTPHTITTTHNPTSHYQHQITGNTVPAGELPAPGPAIFTVPSTRALLDQGVIAPGRPLVQGWTAAGPLLGTPEQTFTAAIGGKGRSGKTRTMALIIGQMVLQGARLLVIDPHRHKPDSLTNLIAPLVPWCLLPPAQSVAEMQAVIARGEAEMEARRQGQHLDELLLLIIDEYTLVQRAGAQIEWGPKATLASRAAGLIESVATEGGGMNMKGLIGGQNWKGTRAGGTEVRQMLQSAWVHRSWAEQARYLVPDTELAAQAESLVPGRAIFVPPDDDPILVGMPLTERADLERIAIMCRASETGRNGTETGETEPPARVIEGRFAPIPAPVSPVSATPETGIDPVRRAAILAGLRTREKYGDLIERVYGVKAGSSQGYQAAYAEFQAILADLARGA